MLRLVEAYTTDDSVVTIHGRTFPAECLIEDDAEGYRFLVVPNLGRIKIHTWVEGHAGGARFIASPGEVGWLAITIDRALANREEDQRNRAYRIERGFATYDHFPTDVEVAQFKPDEERLKGFVHLHAHSEFSALDGLSTVQEMVDAATADNQPALALTDHGVCAGHPVLQHAADKAGIKPIFGIEANFTDDRHLRGDPAKKGHAAEVLADYRHLVLWAMNDTGLRNLWAMSTEANRDGFYGRPRMDWETLEGFNEGVMLSTACLRGPVSRPLLDEDDSLARSNLARLLGIFGDRLYIELQTNALPEQRKVNEALVELAREYGLPVLAAVDSHYPTEDYKHTHDLWIRAQTNKDATDDTGLFVGEASYHMMTEAEVRDALSYLSPQVVDESVDNSLRVAERCSAKVEGHSAAPIFSKAPTEEEAIQSDVRRLAEACAANWHLCQGKDASEEEYFARYQREMDLIIDKGFAGYYLMVHDYCQWAREHGILIGPGRGSGSGSLVAYLTGITSIDPIAADLMFERFLTEGRKALPDFDVDFPTSKRGDITDYIIERYGETNVVRVGTHIRLKNKGVVRDLARVLKGEIDIHYPDIDKISDLIEEAEADKAGLGMPWEDLWEEHGEVLAPLREKYSLLFDHADKMVGRLKTYGKHAAGLVISPDIALTRELPLRLADNDLVAEFDMDSLEELGLVKFDLLTLRTLDTIQEAVDLVREQRGLDIDIYSWEKEYEDPQVWGEISEGHTLGIFQIETAAGTRETLRFQPYSLDELADVITLVRPGPVRSGLTETYFRRKFGQEEITYLDPRSEPILSKTYGAMIYQEQVMKTCMALAGYDETEADVVRKILGKKQVEKVEEAGRKFTFEASQSGTDAEVAQIIWAQMAEFARYSFNRSHAYGYAMLGFWTAWFKFHFPVYFLTAALSTVDKGRIPEFIMEARRMGYRVLPPDINLSGEGFQATGMDIRYGFDGVKGIGGKAVEALMAGQPYSDWDDFMERKGDKANMGVVKTLAQVGVFDSLVPNRRALEMRLEWDTDGSADRCVHKDESVVAEHGLPCTFDWDSEPVQIGRRGKPLKPKPLPKRCTKACRNFTAPEFSLDDDRLYTPEEIMDHEMELLGVHLTHTPFDKVPEWFWDEDKTKEVFGVKIERGSEIVNGPEGYHLTVATLKRVRPHMTKTGKRMGFGAFQALDAEIDVTVFTDEWKKYEESFDKGKLYLLHLRKNSRGLQLSQLVPI